MRLFFLILAALTSLSARAAVLPEDENTAIILTYSRIGEDSQPDTNLTIAQFDEHLAAFLSEDYTILPLPHIIRAWQKNEPLPPRSIALTFDGGYKSAYRNAMIKLIDKKIPFTLFYAADQKSPAFIDTKTLKKLGKNKLVTIGTLPASMARHNTKTDTQIRSIINKTITKHRNIFGRAPTLFAYPYGEFSNAYQNIIKDSGFIAALGLQSGAAFNGSNRFALPRFSMTERYGSIERLHLITKALPLPASDITPSDTNTQTQTIGFTVPQTLQPELNALSCFVSGQATPTIETIGPRVEIRPLAPITTRTRINCTLPAKNGQATLWRWQGFLLAP